MVFICGRFVLQGQMGQRGEPGLPGAMGPPGPQGPNGLSLPGEPVSPPHYHLSLLTPVKT